MKGQFWTYFSILGSVGFGWILNEFSQLVKTRREDKKIKRKVLYLLLEAHFLISRLDTTLIIEEITNFITKKLPEEDQNEQTKIYISKLYHDIINEILETEVSFQIGEIRDNYLNSIDNLALVDPITAFYLRGKTEILNILNELTGYFESFLNKFPDEKDELSKTSEIFLANLKPEIIKTSIEELEKEIICISSKIGFLTFYRSKNLIRKSVAKTDPIRREQIMSFLNKHLSSN